MTAGTEGVTHYDVTRESLAAALANYPLTAYLTLERRGRMADVLLGQMPEVSSAGFYMEGVKAERERITQLAEERKAHYWQQYMSAGDPPEPCMAEVPFAPLIRE